MFLWTSKYFFDINFDIWNVPLIFPIFLSTSLLLLLLSCFSRVRLCLTPQTAAHQAPPSLGFSRPGHWSGLPFPSLLLSFSSISLHCSLQKASCLFLLFSGTLHLVGCTFPFFPCFLPLLFPQLFVEPPRSLGLTCTHYYIEERTYKDYLQ